MNPFRHQLPVYSPLSLRGVLHGAKALLPGARDPRERLRARLETMYRAERAVLAGSGTQALQLGIELALREMSGGGRMVALPAFSCYDIASAAVGADARIALYDLDPATLSPDLQSLERAFRSGARVAVVAHLYGIPVDWEGIVDLAERHEATVIEDSAQGFGGSWKGRPLGSLGRLSVLSFGRGKGWTGGSGGALLLRGGAEWRGPLPEPGRGAALKPVVASLMQWALGRPALFGIPMAVPGLGLGETLYHPPAVPSELPATAAETLLEGFEESAAEAGARRRNAATLRMALLDVASASPTEVVAAGEAGYLRFPVRVPNGLGSIRDQRRARRLGIAPSYPAPLHTLPALRNRLAAPEESQPGARDLAAQLITLPCHSGVTKQQRQETIAMLARDGS